ncbi:MAG: c-type cytochrome [Telluria sp.]
MRVFSMTIAGPATAILCTFLLAGCGDDGAATRAGGGNAKIGKRLIEQYQCGSCHDIPEVAAARGTAGPNLKGFGKRSYIAGRFPNAPATLAQWLVDPQAMKPGTMMPDLGVSLDDARHMAAYLYTLQ